MAGLIVALIILLLPLISPLGQVSYIVEFLRIAMFALMGALAVMSVRAIGASLRRPFTGAIWLAWVLSIGMLLGLTTHLPATGSAMILTLTALGGAALVSRIALFDATAFRRVVALPLLVGSAIQSIVFAAQWITGRPIVLEWLSSGAELEVIDGLLRPAGTMDHVFEPTLLALVTIAVCARFVPGSGIPRAIWLTTMGVIATTLGFSYSRAALLGAIVLLGAVLVAVRRDAPWARGSAIAIGVGLTVAVVLASNGWMHRVDHSTASSLDDATLGRVTQATTALEIIADHPWGVGTDRYLTVLRAGYVPLNAPTYKVHNYSLMLSAELGVAAGILLTGLLGAVAAQAILGGPWPAGVFLAVVPYLAFDILYYDRPSGILILSVWLGSLAFENRCDSSARFVPAPTAPVGTVA